MTVLCCYTDLDPDARAALDTYAPGAELVDVSHSDYAYWGEIAQRWTGTDDLVIIEHGVTIHERVLPEFEICDSLWCTFPYLLSPGGQPLRESMGCVRFRAGLQQMVTPETILSHPAARNGHWSGLDGVIAVAIRNLGISVCVHAPQVSHRLGYRANVGYVEYVSDGDGGKTSDSIG